MAGEKKGDAFEALIFIALKKLGYVAGKTMHWGAKVHGVSIDSDFVIGDLRSPSHWLLATSSGSSKNSKEKLWRNVAELFEVKTNFKRAPTVVNMVFEANLRESIKRAMPAISDSSVLVQDRPYGPALLKFIDSILGQLPASKAEKVRSIEKSLSSRRSLKRPFASFVKDVKESLDRRSPVLDKMWVLAKKKRKEKLEVVAKNTFARRGLAKLTVLGPNSVLRLVRNIKSNSKLVGLPAYSLLLGFAKNTIGGVRIADPDILWVVNNIPPDTIDYVVTNSYQSRKANWDNWIRGLQASSDLSHNQYAVDNYKELVNAGGMLKHLKSHNRNGYKWLFTYLIEVLKYESGKRQGYGYSVLAKDVGYETGISKGYLELSDWANGFLDAPRNEALLADVASALAMRLSCVDVGKLAESATEIQFEAARNLFEQKITSYWLFQPLPLMIQQSLEKIEKPFEMVKYHPTYIGELAGDPQGTAALTVIKSNDVLISYRSAFDLGKHHKTKELSGRGQALRFEYARKRIRHRSGLSKMVLVLDGTFTQHQVDTITASGWDMVFYPDEMSQFEKAIASE